MLLSCHVRLVRDGQPPVAVLTEDLSNYRLRVDSSVGAPGHRDEDYMMIERLAGCADVLEYVMTDCSTRDDVELLTLLSMITLDCEVVLRLETDRSDDPEEIARHLGERFPFLPYLLHMPTEIPRRHTRDEILQSLRSEVQCPKTASLIKQYHQLLSYDRVESDLAMYAGTAFFEQAVVSCKRVGVSERFLDAWRQHHIALSDEAAVCMAVESIRRVEQALRSYLTTGDTNKARQELQTSEELDEFERWKKQATETGRFVKLVLSAHKDAELLQSMVTMFKYHFDAGKDREEVENAILELATTHKQASEEVIRRFRRMVMHYTKIPIPHIPPMRICSGKSKRSFFSRIVRSVLACVAGAVISAIAPPALMCLSATCPTLGAAMSGALSSVTTAMLAGDGKLGKAALRGAVLGETGESLGISL
eukprot:m.257263 g.257263  ORF g.257263 m.257263 type:complete len:422 (-) comp24260_c0_seq1:170-1435(-)